MRIWKALKQTPYFRVTTVILKHHNRKEHHGQLILAFYFLTTVTLFTLLSLYVIAMGADHLTINKTLFHLFRGIRSDKLDAFFIPLTMIGQKEIALTTALIVSVYFYQINHIRTAIHTLLLAFLAAGSVFVTKHLIQSARPWGILNSPETFSMPSGHATLSVAIYLGIIYLLLANKPKRKKWLISLGVLLVMLLSTSRLYLGAHWFTDVLAGWLLGSSIIMLTLLSFYRQQEEPAPLFKPLLVTLLTLTFATGIETTLRYQTFLHNHSLVQWPTEIISETHWWETGEDIPSTHVSLFGIGSQPINIQWAGSLDAIKATLLEMGWSEPPPRNWISTLHRISDVNSTAYLPMISPQYRDEKPIVIVAKQIRNGRKLLVLRLWEAHRTFNSTKLPLWIGTISIVPKSYAWITTEHRQTEMNPKLLLESSTLPIRWEWRYLHPWPNKQTKVSIGCLLIRSKSSLED